MSVKGCASGNIFSQIAHHPNPEFSRPSQLRVNALRRYSINELNPEGDWRREPRISCFRDMIRKKIAEFFQLETNFQWQHRFEDFINILEDQHFREAASKGEYLNQDGLRHRLQLLVQDLSNGSKPTYSAIPTLGLTKGCNLDAANNDSSEHNQMMADTDPFGSLEGWLSAGYLPGVGVTYSTSPTSSKQVAGEMVLSPENSTITTSSNEDGFPEIGALDGGLIFSQGDYTYGFRASLEHSQPQLLAPVKSNLEQFRDVGNEWDLYAVVRQSSELLNSSLQIEHNPVMVSEVSNILPSMEFGIMNSTPENLDQSKLLIVEHSEQQPQLPFRQCNNSSEVDMPCYFCEQNELSSSIAQTNSQLPSEQLPGFFASESSAFHSSFKGSIRPAGCRNQLQFSMQQRILLAYLSYKSAVAPVDDCLVSFVEHLHSKLCNNFTCKCGQFSLLLSRFDGCKTAKCYNCSPLQDLCTRGKLHENLTVANTDLLIDFGDSVWSGSGCSRNTQPPAKRLKLCSSGSEHIQPPSKRFKMENHLRSVSSDAGIASVSAPSSQTCIPEKMPSLKQWPESPVSINSEVNVQMELSTNVMENPRSFDQIKSNAATNLNLDAGSLYVPSKELIVGCESEKMDTRIVGEIADTEKGASEKLMTNNMPVLSASFSEEKIQLMCEFEVAKLEGEKALNAAISEDEVILEMPKTKGVSLIEFFTAQQIKEHILSLGQLIGQRMSKEEEGNKWLHGVEESHCPSALTVNENTCQLCAADRILLAQPPIYCSSCGSRIKRGVIYYSTSEENDMRHCFCTSCHRQSRGGAITFYGITIPKAKLVKKKNDEETEEPWVQCDKCKQWQHQICALFNHVRDMEGKGEYICPKCCLEELESEERMPLPSAAIFNAKDLPSTMLSDHIEQRLLRRLKQEREERAQDAGKDLDEVPRVEDLIVRVVSSVDKQLKVKQQLQEILHDENYPAEFPYRSKVILLFQKIEGVDVCLFSMYVQEFGSECSHPNQRCVYISYLDSVKYFRPQTETAAGEALRTFVYHEILIGYLDYCKKRGFATCYLWACPPLKGEDYILYCHPETQRTPKTDKLRQWYHSMLRKAAKENIVVNVTNLYDQFFVPTGQLYSKITAARLPYFDGDYWSGAAENIIKNMDKQTGDSRKVKKVMTKRTLKAMGHTNPSGGATKDILLMQKLGQLIFPVKEDFIIVQLQFACTHCHEVILSGCRWICSDCKHFQLCERCHDKGKSVNEGDTHTLKSKEKHSLFKVMVNDVPSNTEDKDVILENSLFENRHTFLGFCQKNHYQFDTLRRAKHSSMMILYHLHNPVVPTTGTICRTCHQDTVSKDGDVCVTCFGKKFGSRHMNKQKRYFSTASCETDGEDAQQKALLQKELLAVLQHASQCQATNSQPCSYVNCYMIKKLFHHANKCTIRLRGGCRHCQKVWYGLILHSRNCREADCRVPRCKDLKKHPSVLALKSEDRWKAMGFG